MMRTLRALAVLLPLLAGGCALPSKMPQASLYGASPDTVIIVGKFDIDPPIDTAHEQHTQWNVIDDGAIVNRVAMATADAPSTQDPDSWPMSAWKNYISADWGATFMLSAPRQRLYLNAAMMQLDMGTGSRVWFPGGYYYDPPAGAKAVYIGTLRYSRGDFYTVKKVQVLDEYARANKAFVKRFGTDIRLHKALLRKVK